MGSIGNRLALLLAVLEKRAGLNLAGEDVFVNIAGGDDRGRAGRRFRGRRGCRVERAQPAGSPGTAVFGEIGLAGEVRATPGGLRVREAAQMGFKRCVLPRRQRRAGRHRARRASSCGVRTIGEALDELLAW